MAYEDIEFSKTSFDDIPFGDIEIPEEYKYIPGGRKNRNTQSPKKNEDKKDGGLELFDWVQSIVSALIVGILLFMFVGRIIVVDGTSMLPTLHHTDKIITSNLFYEPENGDIVVLHTPAFKNEPLVKRIIATEGQTVDIDFDAGIVYVDGTALVEPYTYTLTTVREDFYGPVTVPENCVFVMGDNRNGSTDSRNAAVGMVDERCILGKVLCIALPGKDEIFPREWSRIGSVYNNE